MQLIGGYLAQGLSPADDPYYLSPYLDRSAHARPGELRDPYKYGAILPYIKTVLDCVLPFAFCTSGSSYLRLGFDSNFDKAANGCTHGIWAHYLSLNAAQLASFLKAGPLQPSHRQFMKCKLDQIKPVSPSSA